VDVRTRRHASVPARPRLAAAIIAAGLLGVAAPSARADAGADGFDAAAAVDASAAPDAIDAGAAPDAPIDAAAPAVAIPPPPPIAVAPPPAAAPADTGERTWIAIKIVLGLVALLILAYVGGHRRVVRVQERLGIANVIAAGFPFVALGLVASHPSIGILSGEVLARMRPILQFGLGWLGFLIGAQLDIRVLDRLPRGTAYLILVEALAPFAATAAGCGAVMVAFGASWRDPALWRDLVLLGTAAAMTAPRRFRGFANRTWRQGKSVDLLQSQLDEIVGVVGLLFLTAFFRDLGPDLGPAATSSWQIPDTAWLFVSLGLGVAVGILILAIVRVPVSNAEFLAAVVGSIAFASGLAAHLQLSPIVVCFIAGVLLTNFPCDQRASVFRILNHLERPIHLLFLIIAGAVWTVSDWRGWVLVPLFVAARTLGKWLGITAGRATVGAQLPRGFADQRVLVSPLSSLSIALVVSVEGLHDTHTLAWITTAVIGGAALTEVLVQFIPDGGRPARVADDAPPEPVDELDDSGPVYRDPHEDERPPMQPRPPTHVAGVGRADTEEEP